MHTNETTHYDLPQFLASDKGAWLQDINPAFLTIDNQMYANSQAAQQAQSGADRANSAASANAANISGLSALIDSVENDVVNEQAKLIKAEGDIVKLQRDTSGLDTSLKALQVQITSVSQTANDAESSAQTNSNNIHKINTLIGEGTLLPYTPKDVVSNIRAINNKVSTPNSITIATVQVGDVSQKILYSKMNGMIIIYPFIVSGSAGTGLPADINIPISGVLDVGEFSGGVVIKREENFSPDILKVSASNGVVRLYCATSFSGTYVTVPSTIILPQ